MRIAGEEQGPGERFRTLGVEMSLRHVSNEWSSKTVRYDSVGDKNLGFIGTQMERDITGEDDLALGENMQ